MRSGRWKITEAEESALCPDRMKRMAWRGTGAGDMVRRQFVLFLAAFLLLVVLLGVLLRTGRERERALRVVCAAGLREPMTVVAQNYEREFGIPVELSFGGSGALAGQVRMSGGDVFFPADQEYLEPLREQGVVRDAVPVVRLRVGLVVAAGNPKNLRGLSDLEGEGVRLSLADETAAIGRLTGKILREERRWETLAKKVLVTKPTVNGVVEDVALGAADATVAWDAVAAQYEEVEWRELPEARGHAAVAAVAVVTTSERPGEAKRFVRYLTKDEKSARVFRQMGFSWAKDEP